MTRIKIFEESYCNELRREIRNGNLSRLGEDHFDYDNTRELSTNILIDDSTFERIIKCGKDDLFTASRLLYEAFPTLSSLQASYDPFWIHLSLVELYDYLRNVYPDIEKYKSQYVLNHYMMSKFTAYNLCGMWWAVKMTVTKTSNDSNDYSLTKFLLNEHTQLTQSLVESQLFRCQQVTRGVVEYFFENPTECTADIIRETLKHLNFLGSIKQLACISSELIKNEIGKQMPHIKQSLERHPEEKDNP